MRIGSRTHRFWQWWIEAAFERGRIYLELPRWPWRAYCLLRGHTVHCDCSDPAHRYCLTCHADQAHRPITPVRYAKRFRGRRIA